MEEQETQENNEESVIVTPDIVEDKPKDKPVEVKTVAAEHDYTDTQDAIIQAFYSHLAHLLPENGRDYTVNFTFTGRHDECIVKLTGRTRIGIAFIKEIQNYFLNETNDGGNHV